MRKLIILILALSGGLLINSQALSVGMPQTDGTQYTVATLAGEQLRQWNQAQERVEARDHGQALHLNSVQVREMQRLLRQRGYRISSFEDDTIGQGTRAAIRNFQRSNGLAVTGMPNYETIKVLEPSRVQQEFLGLSPEYDETDSK